MSEPITGLTKGGYQWIPAFIAGIDQSKCIGCGRCYKACGRSVLELVEFEEDDDMLSQRMSVGNADDCIGCQACLRVCAKKCHTFEPGDVFYFFKKTHPLFFLEKFETTSPSHTKEEKMKMIRAIIRTNMVNPVADALADAGLPSMTKTHVFGRGKQKGIQVGEVVYDELPKVELMVVVDDGDVDKAVKTIMDAGRTGSIGDGKLFVSAVEQAYTVRTGEAVL